MSYLEGSILVYYIYFEVIILTKEYLFGWIEPFGCEDCIHSTCHIVLNPECALFGGTSYAEACCNMNLFNEYKMGQEYGDLDKTDCYFFLLSRVREEPIYH